nr:hypothetical protein [Conexibacter sp. W3-3-2]
MAVELLGDPLGAVLVGRQQQLQRGVGPGDAPGGVQPRRETEADVGRVHRRRVHPRDAHQRAQARLAGGGERAEPLADEPAVLAVQRHAVRDCRQRDEVEVRVGARRVAAGGAVHGDGELVGDRGRAEVPERVAADPRVDEQRVGQHAVGPGRVVVGDDHVDPGRPGGGDLVDRGDRAVDRDQQLRPAGAQAVDRGVREAVAVGLPVGQEVVDRGLPGVQGAQQDRRRGHAVDVVVPVDRDPRAGPHVQQDQRDRVVDPRERGRIVALLGAQPGLCDLRVVQAASHEDLRDRVADPELLAQRPHGVGRAGGDVQARVHRRRPR